LTNIWLPGGEPIHPFGLVAICWAIWKIKDNACFDKKLIRYPAEIICHAYSFSDIGQVFMEEE
jgi:hypothetical protein